MFKIPVRLRELFIGVYNFHQQLILPGENTMRTFLVSTKEPFMLFAKIYRLHPNGITQNLGGIFYHPPVNLKPENHKDKYSRQHIKPGVLCPNGIPEAYYEFYTDEKMAGRSLLATTRNLLWASSKISVSKLQSGEEPDIFNFIRLGYFYNLIFILCKTSSVVSGFQI